MIQSVKKLAGFTYIDRIGQGNEWVRPQENEQFVGIPHGYYEVGAPGCIEIYEDNKLRYAVNLMDVACVEFVLEANNGK